MDYIATLYDKDIFPNKIFPPTNNWVLRKTVKIILQDSKNKIALVTNPIHNYYLLPGGGIEDGEELYAAADRECQEEVNYSIEPTTIIGVTKEYRGRDDKKYQTYCVLAKVKEKTKIDLRTEEERQNGTTSSWYTLEEVKEIFDRQNNLLKSGEIDFYNIGFNIVRDRIFLRTALDKKLL